MPRATRPPREGGPLPKHHDLEYLEELMRKSPDGLTVAWVCRSFGLSAQEARANLGRLEKDGRAVMEQENRVMVWRVVPPKED